MNLPHVLMSDPWQWARWTLLAAAGAIGLVGIFSPQLFSRLASYSSRWVDTDRIFRRLDRRIDVDRYVLHHSRLFGALVVAAVAVLAMMPSDPWLLGAVATAALAVTLLALLVGFGVSRLRATGPTEWQSGLFDSLPAAWRNRAIDKRPKLLEILSGNVDAMVLNRIQVRHLMTEVVETAQPDTPVEDIAELMTKNRMRHLPVCRENGRLVGIISDRDLYCRQGSVAGDIMTSDAVSVQHTTPLVEAIDFMLLGNFSCLPVFRGDALCGIITTADVILAMRCSLEVLQQRVRGLLAGSEDGASDTGEQREVASTETCLRSAADQAAYAVPVRAAEPKNPQDTEP